jgi:hypothetical protein
VTSHNFLDRQSFSQGPDALGNGVSNPFTFRFDQAWLGTFGLQVEVYDDDSADFVVDTDPDLVATMKMEKYGVPVSSASIVSSLVNGFSKLTLQWKVVCDEYQYGNCSVYCKPQNSDVTGHYTCNKDGNKVCQPGWTGGICTIDATVCNSRPCLNGGLCNVTAAGFKCTCSPGFVGSICEHDVSGCQNSPCLNGGTCQSVGNTYTCVCAGGFTGRHCTEDINDCESNCINGVCIDKGASYSCVCNTGYTGTSCESDAVIGPSPKGSSTLDSSDGGVNVAIYAGAGAGAGAVLIIIIIMIVVLMHMHRRRQSNLNMKDSAVGVKFSQADSGGDTEMMDSKEPCYATVGVGNLQSHEHLISENPLYGETAVSNARTMEGRSGCAFNGQTLVQDKGGYMCMSGNKGTTSTGVYDKPKPKG